MPNRCITVGNTNTAKCHNIPVRAINHNRRCVSEGITILFPTPLLGRASHPWYSRWSPVRLHAGTHGTGLCTSSGSFGKRSTMATPENENRPLRRRTIGASPKHPPKPADRVVSPVIQPTESRQPRQRTPEPRPVVTEPTICAGSSANVVRWCKLLIIAGLWISVPAYIVGSVTVGLDQVMYLGSIRSLLLWGSLIGAVVGPFVTLTGWSVWFWERD
jgi:hypothetical protein